MRRKLVPINMPFKSLPPIDPVKIRRLNDEFRRSFVGGKIITTLGVNEQGPEKVAHLLRQVRSFDQFDADNDPYGEHDFGAFTDDGQRYFFKIDYYDLTMKYRSEDPGDQIKTIRVLTLMLAAEW
jgi:hypothetical protein